MPVPGIDPLSTYASLSGAGTDSLVSLLQKPNSGVPAALVLSELMRRQRIGREGYNESDLANQTYESSLRNPNNYMAAGGGVRADPKSPNTPEVKLAPGVFYDRVNDRVRLANDGDINDVPPQFNLGSGSFFYRTMPSPGGGNIMGRWDEPGLQDTNPQGQYSSGGAVGLPYSFADPQVLQAYGQSAGDYPAPQRSSASSSSRKGMRRGGQVKFGPGGAVGSGGITQLDQGNPLGLSAADSQGLSDVALLNMLGGNFGGQGSGQTVQGPFGTLNYGSAASLPNMSGLLSGNGQQATISGRWGQDHVPPPEPSYAQGPSAPNSPAATQRGAAVPTPVNPRGPMPAGGVSALPAAPASGPPGTIGGAIPVSPGQGGITNSPDQGGIMGTDFNPNNFLINTGLALAASHNPRFTQALGESAQGAYQGEMQRRMAVYGIQKDVALKMQEFGKDLAVEQIKAMAPGDQEKLVSRMEADPKFADSVHGYFNRQMFRQDPVMAFSSIMNQLQRDDPTMVPGSPEWAAAAQIVQQQIQQASQAQGNSSGGVPSVAPTARPYTDFTQ